MGKERGNKVKKKYIKPKVEFVELRIEDSIAANSGSCANTDSSNTSVCCKGPGNASSSTF